MVRVNSIPRILSIDYGLKRVGLALSVPGTKIVKPYRTLLNQQDLQETISAVIKDEKVDVVVVGLPRSINGNETEQTVLCRTFADRLSGTTNVGVVMQDEAATSLHAEVLLKNAGGEYVKTDVDAMAAALIGQDYMEQLV